ncbi:hypothetical protein WOLCODRAFT_159930 [Wolfiporia cocos MD-104 SS10]|uniref:Poly A polymerase head domain-containing protein n=1 Tax=Wolfiporia cocos (strain MD-104) TaxID=742152 RepID=A0A2H3ITB9_WOLCO|nr:hypothetical protein WOLCODRAFT_159930 [Wolfiporia cocos MD-104 SS10]
MEIMLTEQEDRLCTLLDQCTKEMKERDGLETSCRIAGGWVRDKLLGLDSNDIDIALTDMMGVTFAEYFVAFCSKCQGVDVKGVTKIASNPEQSKHLETARTTVLGYEIDFVNLRSEEYAAGSRIPTQITFGTPLQDALRRDITINALFYNVHTRSVEDYTEKGLDDLKNGIIRTPLSPRETFIDDPLRVIRCIRFASRLGFEVVQELRDAMRNHDILKALVTKISRERVGEEVHKMMKGRDPVRAIQLIDDLSLYSSIFLLPQVITSLLSEDLRPSSDSVAAATILGAICGTVSTSTASLPLPSVHPFILSETLADRDVLGRIALACALTPYRGITYTDAKGKTHPAAEAVLRDGLKLGTQNHYLDGIPGLFAAWDILSERIAQYSPRDDDKDRAAIGMLLREKSVHWQPSGSHWSSSMLFSLVQDLVSLWDTSNGQLDIEVATKRIEAYNAFSRRIEELELPLLVDKKPILDGRDVARVLDTKPGPWTGHVLNSVIEWQLEHPRGSKEDCEEWLRAERAAGRIDTNAIAAPAKRGKEDRIEDGKAKRVKR